VRRQPSRAADPICRATSAAHKFATNHDAATDFRRPFDGAHRVFRKLRLRGLRKAKRSFAACAEAHADGSVASLSAGRSRDRRRMRTLQRRCGCSTSGPHCRWQRLPICSTPPQMAPWPRPLSPSAAGAPKPRAVFGSSRRRGFLAIASSNCATARRPTSAILCCVAVRSF
jgi:hypothetical protein